MLIFMYVLGVSKTSMIFSYFDFIILQKYFLPMKYFYPICYMNYSFLPFGNFLYPFTASTHQTGEIYMYIFWKWCLPWQMVFAKPCSIVNSIIYDLVDHTGLKVLLSGSLHSKCQYVEYFGGHLRYNEPVWQGPMN